MYDDSGRARVGAAAAAARRAWVLAAVLAGPTLAQGPALPTVPDPTLPDLSPHWRTLTCPVRMAPEDAGEAERIRFEQRAAYRDALPAFLTKLPPDVDRTLLMPVDGVSVSRVADTWHAPRGNRLHEGQDIFAPRGTPVRSATVGFVYEISDRFRGGRSVMVLGPGGRRYFYTHLDAYADGLAEGQAVTPDTVLGYVGDDGNANGTPPHLHFGAFDFDPSSCRFRALDPLPMLVDRR
jgi:peptidoglycan LD-endopeptidase LytH